LDHSSRSDDESSLAKEKKSKGLIAKSPGDNLPEKQQV